MLSRRAVGQLQQAGPNAERLTGHPDMGVTCHAVSLGIQLQAALNRVGRGGLGEAAADAGLMPGAGGGTLGEEDEGGHDLLLGAGRREDAAVATRELQ